MPDPDLLVALEKLDAAAPRYAAQFVELLLEAAQQQQATDIHLQPTPNGLDVRWRLDGVLQPVGLFPRGATTDVVTRLKVLADLLTYRADVPQEGRIRGWQQGERRVSTFPTLHGERAVVRLFPQDQQRYYLEQLGLPADIEAALARELTATSGALIVSGPAGSGKTTTIYACLRQLLRAAPGGRSIVALEDPIEVEVPGVAQSQIQAAAGFDFATGVRSVMRQDPEVIMIGEMRDRATVEAAYAASLTGHLVLTTFHAGSAAEALCRVADMGVEPYLLRSGTRAVLCQRLVRRLCDCKRPADDAERLGLPVAAAWSAVGCLKTCGQTGYRGRLPLAEWLPVAECTATRAVLGSADVQQVQTLAEQHGMMTQSQRAQRAVEQGLTSPAEVLRVLGV